jgi:hypothetical protein
VKTKTQKTQPYHDPKWLRKELLRYGSLSSLCKVHRFSEATVADYLSRHPEVKAQVQDLLQKPRFLQNSLPTGGAAQMRLATLKRHKQQWTINELEAQGLPFYWDHDWLIEEFRKLRSLGAIARKYGYKPGTLQRYISRQPELARRIWAVREQMQSEQIPVLVNTPPELAERMKALVDTTQRELLVKAIRHEYAKRKKESSP